MTTTIPRQKLGSVFKNFGVDMVLFIVFVVEMNVHFTGISIHEWLGIAAGMAIVVHLLLHWEWIVTVMRRIVGKLPAIQRIKYILDILIFIDFVVIGATGLWISKVAMGQIGVEFAHNSFWRWLHTSSADWGVWLIGLHLALNWKWVLNALKCYVWQPVAGLGARTKISTGGVQ